MSSADMTVLGLLLQPQLHAENAHEIDCLDPNVSVLSNTDHYPVQLILKLDNVLESSSDWSFATSDEPRRDKRLKLTLQDGEEPVGSYSSFSITCRSTSNNSLNSLPMLQFRDHVGAYMQSFLAVEAMEEAAAVLMRGDGTKPEEELTGEEMKLVQQLISCAEAVVCRDKTHASALLTELSAKALVLGTSFQRVASCFVQALSNCLALVQPLGAVGVVGQSAKLNISSEKEEALRLTYEICPYIQFGHFIANAMILEAFEVESSVHVVDLGMSLCLPYGHQWLNLMHSLARASKPICSLRITGVSSGRDCLLAIGTELESYAESLGLNFEFLSVDSSLENLQPEDFSIMKGEVLVINSVLQLHCVVKESRGALNSVLQMLQKLSPKLLVLVEQDSSHNGPFFLGRSMEALHYYSAIFDSLDAMLPKYDTKRAKMEQFFFADEINNIVSCEGPARVERHERIDQWRRRMSRAGFHPVLIKLLTQAKEWLGKGQIWEGHIIVEEKGCLILGWNMKPIIAASSWKCS